MTKVVGSKAPLRVRAARPRFEVGKGGGLLVVEDAVRGDMSGEA